MDAAWQSRAKREAELLRELAELAVEEQVEAGVFLETPHYSVIECMAVTLGHELSHQAQERATWEVAASFPAEAACVLVQREMESRALLNPTRVSCHIG